MLKLIYYCCKHWNRNRKGKQNEISPLIDTLPGATYNNAIVFSVSRFWSCGLEMDHENVFRSRSCEQ